MYKLMSNQYIPYKGNLGKTYWYIVDKDGKTIDKKTLKPYRGKEMNRYAMHSETAAQAFVDALNQK